MIWANVGKWTHDSKAHKSQSKELSTNPKWPDWFNRPQHIPNLSEVMLQKDSPKKKSS